MYMSRYCYIVLNKSFVFLFFHTAKPNEYFSHAKYLCVYVKIGYDYTCYLNTYVDKCKLNIYECSLDK